MFAVSLNSIFLIIIPIPTSPLVPELIANVLIGGIIGYLICTNNEIFTIINDSIKSLQYDKLVDENKELKKTLKNMKKIK